MGVSGSKQEEVTEVLLQIAALFVFITSYYPAKRIKKNNMGMVCGMYRGGGSGFVGETRVEESTCKN